MTDRQLPEERHRIDGDRLLGLRVRKLRQQRRLSLAELAQQAGRSKGWLLAVENGRTDPRYGELIRLAEVLRVGMGVLISGRSERTAEPQPFDFTSVLVDSAVESEDVKTRREFARELAAFSMGAATGFDFDRYVAVLAGTRADERALDDFERITIGLIRHEAIVSPQTLVPAVRGHLAGLCDVLVWTPAELAGRAYSLAGQTALLAGYLMFKLARHVEADAYWAAADRFGKRAGDARLRAALLVLRAQRRQADGHLVDALVLLDQAMSVLGQAPEPGVTAHVLTFRSKYHAQASQADWAHADQALRDLDSVQDHLTCLDSDATVYIVESVAGEAIQSRGWALNHLNRPGEAAADLEQLLASMGDASLTWRSHVVADLAMVRSKMGDPDRACDLLNTGLTLAMKASAPRSENRIRERRRLITDYDGAALRDLDEQLRALASTATGALPAT